MGETTGIAWCDSTFNAWLGCTKVSDGCDGCYAEEQFDHRYHLVEWGPHGERHRTGKTTWRGPRIWNKKADAFEALHGRSRRVFSLSEGDWLDNQVPPEWRADLLALIDETPRLIWQLLTKRPENAGRFVPAGWFGRQNIWLGVSAENQECYDHRWPILARIPAAVRFISYEPALAPLTIKPFDGVLPDWVIVGGESRERGKQARPFDLAWARDVLRQCRAAGVKCLIKQMGSNPIECGAPIKLRDRKGGDPDEWPQELRVREWPTP